MYGSNDYGYDHSTGAGSSITINAFGSNDGTNWTNIGGNISFTNLANESSSRTITPTSTTAYRYHAIKLTTSSNYRCVAEIQYFECASSGSASTFTQSGIGFGNYQIA